MQQEAQIKKELMNHEFMINMRLKNMELNIGTTTKKQTKKIVKMKELEYKLVNNLS